ncbi:GNAT family N-acetyltransferase [Bradyrhizobium liaoningense]|uniref:GNAT family N-acetyltransferase n=1 Tax=Bradyrhizobium liaoningense TaxID=43992 RepID=UPI001BABF924|nr:GNAT family N-acetyltransferase [Bradyrhizobium liaoningense]MBR0840732.1 GNAT family N-acetyltransferase [Bradyrhizobium liaoningense]
MIEIIAISEAHIESFHRALDTVARERRYLAFLEAPPLEAVRSFVLDMIAQGNPQFVALSGGEAIGWCDVRRHPRPIYAHAGILGMGLLQPFRGQGIGTRLISTTLATAQAAHMTRVELSVRENNLNAIALYKRVGFTVEGLSRNAVKIDGVYENVIQMTLLFSSDQGCPPVVASMNPSPSS